MGRFTDHLSRRGHHHNQLEIERRFNRIVEAQGKLAGKHWEYMLRYSEHLKKGDAKGALLCEPILRLIQEKICQLEAVKQHLLADEADPRMVAELKRAGLDVINH